MFDIRERQSARMSNIKNGELDQYGAEPFEQQQLGTAGVEGVNLSFFVTKLMVSPAMGTGHLPLGFQQ